MPLFVRKGTQVPTKPPTVVRARVEPNHVAAHFPVGSERMLPPVRVELAPLPIPQSAYYGVGRDSQHVGQMFAPPLLLAIPEWQGVMAWPFNLLKVPTALRVPIAPHQGMTPFAERVNIDMSPQTTLSALTSIKAPPTWAPQYAKLGVWS